MPTETGDEFVLVIMDQDGETTPVGYASRLDVEFVEPIFEILNLLGERIAIENWLKTHHVKFLQ
jgi:hypothetical protein